MVKYPFLDWPGPIPFAHQGAHRDGGRTVHYRLRGSARVVRRSHEDAHYLARKLETFGFQARVEHE